MKIIISFIRQTVNCIIINLTKQLSIKTLNSIFKDVKKEKGQILENYWKCNFSNIKFNLFGNKIYYY